MSDPAADDRTVAAVATHLLAQGAMVHRLSSALTIASLLAVLLLVLLLPPTRHGAIALVALAVIAGVVELWFALRVAFDARIFRLLSRGDSPDGLTLSAFDTAMGTVGLMPPDKRGRPVAARLQGALRLLRWQVTLLLTQVAVLLATSAIFAVLGG